MEALARPGTVQKVTGAVPPAPLSIAAGAALLTLCDTDTPLYLAGAADCDAVRSWIAFHTGAPLTGPEHCMFAVGDWTCLAPLSRFPIGTAEFPDRSATLIVECPDFDGPACALRGPGIYDTAHFPLPDREAIAANHALFPLGLDFFFTSGDRIAALPRSTEICAAEVL
jgi:alpha-D-ribose 1-methylphosphonate 5-triphosphate synthase subunit PhnH